MVCYQVWHNHEAEIPLISIPTDRFDSRESSPPRFDLAALPSKGWPLKRRLIFPGLVASDAADKTQDG